MRIKFALCLSASLLLSACGEVPATSSSTSGQTSSETSTSAESSSSPNTFKTETINAYYTRSENDTTCELRYYNQGLIPYISIKDFHGLLYRGRTYTQGRDKFDIQQNGSAYTITVAGDYTATFDVEANTMVSSDLWSFKCTNLQNIGPKASVSYDGLPFTRVKSVVSDKPAQTTTIDFSKYHLKIYGDENAVYVPLAFATDLFSNENILQGAYNNKDLFIFNYTENESLDSFGGLYYEPIFKKAITQEYADYVYNELCLDYDVFLGRPGRSSLEVYYDLSLGFDSALNSRPLGRTIAEYMKSTDLAKFLAGSAMLGMLHQDGGHSDYNPLNTGYSDSQSGTYRYPSWLTDEVLGKAQNLVLTEYEKDYEELTNYDRSFSHRGEVRKARSEKLGKRQGALKGTETYTKDGDVAYIHIDGFMGEIGLQNEWNAYYRGGRDTIPFGEGVGGAVGAINYGVTQASKDKEIKHLVIDLAGNSGGSTDEMLFVIALLTGSKNFYTRNTLSGTWSTVTYEFDLNLDRVFDEKDEEMRNLIQGMDVSVLTTRNGFSCGGISPIYLHDEGIFTIGEECGGGSCSVYMQYDGFGNLNRSSSPSQTTTKNGVNIDIARKTVCDQVLEFPSEENVYDYSSLYDTSTLRSFITAHYTN